MEEIDLSDLSNVQRDSLHIYEKMIAKNIEDYNKYALDKKTLVATSDSICETTLNFNRKYKVANATGEDVTEFTVTIGFTKGGIVTNVSRSKSKHISARRHLGIQEMDKKMIYHLGKR